MQKKIYKITIALEDGENGFCPSEMIFHLPAETAEEALEKGKTKIKELSEPEGYYVNGVEFITDFEE